MVLYLYGPDTQRSRQHLEKLVEKFYRERDPQRMNVSRLVVGEIEDSDIQMQTLAVPFLAEKRMVVLERLLECGSDELLAWFDARFVQQPASANVIVIVWEEDPAKRSKQSVGALHTTLAAGQFAQEFAPLDGKRREQFVVKFLADRSVGITHDAMVALARRVADMYELTTALEVLAAFGWTKKGQPLTARDLDLFLPPDIENTIFKAMDDLSAQQRHGALAQLAQVWYADNDSVYVFAMVHRQIRLLVEAQEVLSHAAGASEQSLARELGVHPFVAKKLMGVAARWPREDLCTWYEHLHDIDFAMKHSVADPRILMNRFVAA